MNRGVERRDIFAKKSDREYFEGLLKESVSRYAIEIISYVLLSNHFHLVLRTPEPNLSQAMKWLQGTWAGEFNRRQKRKGPLFQGRFRAILVGEQNYLNTLSAYVHWNPVRAAITASPIRYRWSSCREYLRRHGTRKWIRPEPVLSSFGKSAEEQRQRYRKWLYGVQGQESAFLDELQHGYLLGSDRFLDWVRRKFGAGAAEEQPVKKKIRDEAAVERVLHAAAQVFKVEIDELRKPRLRAEAALARQAAMLVLWRQTSLGASRIGRELGVSPSAVNKAGQRLEAKMKQKPKLREQLERIYHGALQEPS